MNTVPTVQKMTSPSGREVPNQFIIDTEEYRVFQSYQTTIAVVNKKTGKITLDTGFAGYSATTSKYLARFLRMKMREIKKAVKNGKFDVEDLN